jgi:hypothetical protein
MILVVCLVTGCTTLRTITLAPEGSNNAIRPNDHIRVTMLNGQVLEFTVKEIAERSILGINISDENGQSVAESERINLGDVAKMERREYSHPKTSGLIVGLSVVVVQVIFKLLFPHGIY